MKKFDLILIIAVLVVAGGLYFSGILKSKEVGATAIISVDGKAVKELSLDTDTEYDITENGHINKLVIKEGYADIVDADCPDKLCVNQKKINLKNETIVCLPNKVVVEIEGAKDSEIDSVAN